MIDLVRELECKVAIMTGSARKIGRATALELARAGASLVINARQAKEPCEEVANEITDAGGRAIPIVADITDPEAVGRGSRGGIRRYRHTRQQCGDPIQQAVRGA